MFKINLGLIVGIMVLIAFIPGIGAEEFNENYDLLGNSSAELTRCLTANDGLKSSFDHIHSQNNSLQSENQNLVVIDNSIVSVTTDPVYSSDITSTTAVLRGHLANTVSGTDYTVWFRYHKYSESSKYFSASDNDVHGDSQFSIKLEGLEPDTIYCYRAIIGYPSWIEASNYKRFTTKSAVSAPNPPIPTSPGTKNSPGDTITTLTPTLKWQASPGGADYYALAISKSPYGASNVIYKNQRIYGTSWKIPSGKLQYGTKYRWNMQAHKSGQWSTRTSRLYFQTTNPTPNPPIPTSPGTKSPPGDTITTLTPTLKWQASPGGADYYALAISKSPYGASNVIYENQRIYDTSWKIPSGKLQYGTKYRWNMQAHKSGQWSTITSRLYFQTTNPTPNPPIPTSPGTKNSPGDTITTLTPTLKWQASPGGADYYALAISKSPYGASNVIYKNQRIYGTSWKIPSGKLQYGTKYRWNMQAHKSGQWSTRTSRLYFQTTNPTPKTGSILVTSSPSGAKIYLDGSYKGPTSQTLYDVSTGSHTIRLTKTGYNERSGTVTVTAGNTASFYRELPPATHDMSVPLYSQADPRWATDHLGTGSGTLRDYGCALTSTAMVISKYGDDVTPKILNKWLIANNGYSYGSDGEWDIINWGRAADFDNSVVWLEKIDYYPPDKSADMARINKELGDGHPVIAKVKFGTKQLTHFVVLTGYSGDTYYINDPADGTKQTLDKSRYGTSNKDIPSHRIYGIRVYGPSGNTASVIPTLFNPGTSTAPGTNIDTLTPDCSWEGVDGVNGYRIYVSECDQNGKLTKACIYVNPPLNSQNGEITDSHVIIPDGVLKADKYYCWNVEPKTNGIWSKKYADLLYFSTSDIAPAPTPDLQQKAVNLAIQLEGTSYLWGGKGFDYSQMKWAESSAIKTGYNYWNPNKQKNDVGIGVDCSGLIMWSYNMAYGATKFRDSSNPVYFEGAADQWSDSARFQQKSTALPSRSDLAVGDLLFIGTTNRNSPNHVGMYIGNGSVIHSKGSAKVEVKSLNDWLNLPVSTNKKYRNCFTGYGNVKASSTPTPLILTEVRIAPDTASIEINQNQQFVAKGYDQHGNEMTGLTFVWSLSDTTVGTIDSSTGLFTAIKAGKAMVSANSGGKAGNAQIIVKAKTPTPATELPEHSLYIGDTAVSINYLIGHPGDAQTLVNQLIGRQSLTLVDLWYRINGGSVQNIMTGQSAGEEEKQAIQATLETYIDGGGEAHDLKGKQ